MLKVHANGKPLADDVDLDNIAKRTPYATGADLENIMNEAAILAARARKTKIDQALLIEAVERVQMGPEKKSHKVLEEERKLVAFHEAGHAIIGHYLPLCDDVHTVTIVPRGGGAGGFTLALPEKELDYSSRSALLQRISMILGGHASEKLVFNEIKASEIIKLLLPENTPDCHLFLAWMPQVKSVFLYQRKRLEVVFQDGTTYNLTSMPKLYDKLFSIRHGA